MAWPFLYMIAILGMITFVFWLTRNPLAFLLLVLIASVKIRRGKP